MTSVNEQLGDLTIERALIVNRYGAGLGRDVVKLLREAQADIIRRLPETGGVVTKARLARQLREINELIGEAYGSISAKMLDELTDLGEIESGWQMSSINNAATVDIMRAMPSPAVLASIARDTLVTGSTIGDWLGKQEQDYAFQISRAVRAGLAQSETIQQIANRVREASGVAQRHAFTLGKTATQAIAVEARNETLKANGDVVKGKLSLATLDSHTTFVCASYDKAAYNLDNEPIEGNKLPYLEIPRHFGCRSWWQALLKRWDEMGLPFDEFKPSTRASMDGQIPQGTSFPEFLDGKSQAWQDNYLGKGRAKLYRDGKITLADLVDGTGRELTIKELKSID
jgi:hypothetical protein